MKKTSGGSFLAKAVCVFPVLFFEAYPIGISLAVFSGMSEGFLSHFERQLPLLYFVLPTIDNFG
jgi:hypothetical protein